MSTVYSPTPLIVDYETDHLRGAFGAKVTIMEYGDFQCPDCAQAHGALKILRQRFGLDMMFVFRHFPLREVHQFADSAAEASEAACAQGMFWSMYEVLFQNQRCLKPHHLLEYARRLGMDVLRFEDDLKSRRFEECVQADVTSGQRLKLRGVPSFFVNGSFVDLSFGTKNLQRSVEEAFSD